MATNKKVAAVAALLLLDDFDIYIYALLELIRPQITKQDTIMRTAVSEEARLMAILRFLATRNSYEDLKFSAGISPQLLGHIVPETCLAIYNALKVDYLKVRANRKHKSKETFIY